MEMRVRGWVENGEGEGASALPFRNAREPGINAHKRDVDAAAMRGLSRASSTQCVRAAYMETHNGNERGGGLRGEPSAPPLSLLSFSETRAPAFPGARVRHTRATDTMQSPPTPPNVKQPAPATPTARASPNARAHSPQPAAALSPIASLFSALRLGGRRRGSAEGRGRSPPRRAGGWVDAGKEEGESGGGGMWDNGGRRSGERVWGAARGA